ARAAAGARAPAAVRPAAASRAAVPRATRGPPVPRRAARAAVAGVVALAAATRTSPPSDRPVRPLHRSTTMAKPPARKPKKKVCVFCKEKISYVDYKDTNLLRKFISDRGKIRARRVTGNCTQHQRDVATAVKNSREMALLPYTSTAR